ncbi:heme oxygenase-like protein [Aureobasidium pullulans]|nr:heme oxygenase-like protein [Aureobasidium pullulans]
MILQGRSANAIIQRAFVEFQDDDNPTKCNKVRCTYCGFVRAKNTTRQVEHLQECQQYLNSPDYVESLNDTDAQQPDEGNTSIMSGISNSPLQATPNSAQRTNFLMGQRPNPNLLVNRRGPNKRTRDGQVKNGQRSMPPPITPAPPAQTPSLAAYLLTQNAASFTSATQTSFLSHAGCGTLSAGAMSQWLAQDSHVSRGYIAFVGQLIGKIRLPIVANSQSHPLYRAMDLLISALNNVRREMSFFEITATKYNLNIVKEEPNPITRSFLDLFVSASSPAASLLEGAVVLWAVEHCYRASWAYAASFSSSLNQPILPYSSNGDSHNAALHQSLIPNWTSPAFAKFVEACKAVVDELANAETSPNGREQMSRCLSAFNQVLWLWERTWPSVDGMGEENESASAERFNSNGMRPHSSTGGGQPSGVPNRDNAADDDDDVVEIRRESAIGGGSPYVSPYGTDGLRAVEAANNA